MVKYTFPEMSDRDLREFKRDLYREQEARRQRFRFDALSDIELDAMRQSVDGELLARIDTARGALDELLSD